MCDGGIYLIRNLVSQAANKQFSFYVWKGSDFQAFVIGPPLIPVFSGSSELPEKAAVLTADRTSNSNQPERI
ncbi:MAG TPA: hypothetical protein DCM07_31150 [Planctomycetaceae bacterium]|nr:hypothetical protein [Gimesia sp.]HAH49219.1 hypothetical protein [Planctomycetaceae bacterium]HBL46240.1 hypothetical protein [Planctomycetaceae bacterium]